MLFHTYDYVFLFLPLVWITYLVLRRTTFTNVILLIASYVFYCYESFHLIFFILFSSTLDFIIGPRIEAATSPRRRKALLAVSIVGNLGLLFVLKYFAWLFNAFRVAWSGMFPEQPIAWKPPEFILPPGISFYTFQTLTYTIDIYRGQFHATRDRVKFFTYVALFPQLVAGPIERCRDLLPQLTEGRKRASAVLIEHSLFLIGWGLFKKLVLADNLGNIADLIYLDPKELAGGVVILPLAFCFQIYCDFSAYTDIARGTAGLFNIQLSRNFLTPYFATSPSDFWRRWHITLSTWLRDYLYIPLGGERHGRLRTLRNLVITMFLGGLWHGAGLFFILWGLYHGFLLVLYRLFPLDEWLIRRGGRSGRALATLLMFCLTCFGWLLFRTDLQVFGPLMGTLGDLWADPGNARFWSVLYVTALFAVPVLLTDFMGFRRGGEFVDLYPRFSVPTRVAIYVVIFFVTSLFAKREGYAFIYFQF